jgi:hypothetical protein
VASKRFCESRLLVLAVYLEWMQSEASNSMSPTLHVSKEHLVPGLAQSLYDDNDFRSCLRKDNHTLVVEGIAGAGKTTTLAMLTRRLKANWQAKLELDPESLFVGGGMVDEQVLGNLYAESSGVWVTLEVPLLTLYGESVSIIGSIPQLGSWSIQDAPFASCSSLYTQQYPLWYVTIRAPPGSRFEWKYIHHKSDGSTLWQEGPNSEYVVPHAINTGARRAHNVGFDGREDAGARRISTHHGLTRPRSKECVTQPQNQWRVDDIDEVVAVACVWYDSMKPDQHDPTKILMSLLLQLINQIPELDEVGISLHERKLKGLSAELEDIGNAIIQIFNRIRSGCIIIDALDECASKSTTSTGAIDRTLREVKRIQAETSIGVVLSRRRIAPGKKGTGLWLYFEHASHHNLKAKVSTIRDYVQRRLKDFSLEYHWDNEERICKKITDVVVQSCGSL